jgi:hypothetical protein
LKLNGANIALKAKAKVGLQGATTEVKGSDKVILKGGAVNIN